MRELNSWFLENRRELPWRIDPTPYRVWISEVMLQQTRASVVIPYFERWMTLFPDVAALAAAPIERVIKTWEGLGYYSRARNLHRGAQQMVESFGGEVPSDREALMSIKGLGPYTIGAILSFGFQKRAAAVDGNVTRVLARYFSIEENVGRQSVKRLIGEKAEAILDEREPWVTAEALIELGATVCTPKPFCELCPLQKSCLGKDKAESLPIKHDSS
jgi:A/G-specific adenine glycosylase